MATYALIHGGGDSAWCWHLLVGELRERGHDVVAVDLPCEDESAGLWDYADTVVDAIAGRTHLVVVGHSLGGFTAPLVCARVPVDLLVLVAGMVPSPGETGAGWGANTDYPSTAHEQEAHEDGEIAVFYHDVPPELAAEGVRTMTGSPAQLRADASFPMTGGASCGGAANGRSGREAGGPTAGNRTRRSRCAVAGADHRAEAPNASIAHRVAEPQSVQAVGID